MNKSYKIISFLLLCFALLIICGIVLSAFFNRTGLMMNLSLADGILVIWFLLFIFILLGLIFYRHKIISLKLFITSMVLIFVNYYLTYLCQFIHTPDIFSSDDFIWSTKRFFFHFPKTSICEILQGLSYIISVIVKDKKQLKGLRTNLIISLLRIILFVFTMIPFFMDDILIMGSNLICSFSLVLLIYFVISCVIEFGIDFVIKKCQKPAGQ